MAGQAKGSGLKKLQACLQYELTWGQAKEKLYERWKSGKKTPVIEKWPKLQPGLELFWDAFLELNTDRPQGFSKPGPIPFTSIYHFATAYGIQDQDFEELRYFIRVLDSTWLKHHDGKE
jgi:hypothetical protein